MNKITIHNDGGVVNVYNINDNEVAKAKSDLLNKMYYARRKPTLGGYDAWLKLVDMYHANRWQDMYDHISACKGSGGKTRKECLRCLNTIISGD